VLLRRLVEPGASVAVGAPLLLLGSRSEVGADIDALLVELGVQGSAPAPPPRAETNGRGRIFATPLSRRLLAQAGIDLQDVTGTGPNGRITKKDALQAAARRDHQPPSTPASSTPASAAEPAAAEPAPAPEPAPRPAVAAAGSFAEIEHSRLRRAVAARLTSSKQTVPHFYVKRSARIDALLRLRAELNDISPQRISVNDLVIRAVAAAHVAVPEANVIWTDEAMRSFDSVDIGVAIASERGLVTPVLRDVQDTTPGGVARKVHELVEQANAGRLAQRDLEGGAITVTNLGMYGVEEFAAIINPPQSAILAVGAGVKQPVVIEDKVDEADRVEIATMVNLVLSVDHRAIDGALAARWMATLVDIVEKPLRLLI